MDHDLLQQKSEITRRRYDRIARFYDVMQAGTERRAFQKWRQQLWARVTGKCILEVGVGTGRNIPYYPPGTQTTAVDLSKKMLAYARQEAKKLAAPVDLRVMNAHHLEFPDGSFDTVVATFVFCSVPDPVLGLREICRVTKPGGDIWLLEHMRIDKPLVGSLMDVLNPLAVRTMGANINRRTMENVRQAGLKIVEVELLMGDFVRLIHARPA